MKNYSIIQFKGYSMYPFLRPGDRLVIKKASPNSLQVGDIAILTNSGSKHIAHRLIRKLSNDAGIFKGDSLLNPDPETVELSVISGRVDAIIRDDRFIHISNGLRARTKRLYAILSRYNLTWGTLRLKAKKLLKRLNLI